MSVPFPRTRTSSLGYDTEEVDDFLAKARLAYDDRAAGPGGAPVLTSEMVRSTAFTMQKGGYYPPAVDAALERLEDAFALRERDAAYRETGDERWYADARQRAAEILARLERPEGKRFTKAGPLSVGYHPKDVDEFADHLVEYFRSGADVSVTDVRTVAFRSRRGGYSEAQVDAVLDAVVDVMLAVR
ncbi:DivIVA domain-containing protein [Herbiconiux sp. KACC 21604]|uniref:DivIVA domain-containing protein n=1 Tax=unclassified Herbiconiux TaxID=2618217 RepID=UPI0014924CF1|nr:DivIVA domain-containing protein [Herbiconiux sp. SALV-R1]QJU52872.1 DivIVA domain-containing protein [Herbiconiux sp. SALV-R1]WPO87790.1 DivIVA domain-containing protein [Herbiconiux sp. KACC 21604]